jgi:probable phosphoglycerate mutase
MGFRQAEAAAQRITRDWRPDTVYASSLQRALQTAAAIARACNLRTVIHDGLLDVDYGAFAGLTPEEAMQQYPEVARAWRDSPQTVDFPGGESLADVRARAEAALTEIINNHLGQTIVVVTHVVVCRLVLCSLLALDNSHFWQFEPATASITVFQLSEQRGVLLALNDTCHVAGLSDKAG